MLNVEGNVFKRLLGLKDTHFAFWGEIHNVNKNICLFTSNVHRGPYCRFTKETSTHFLHNSSINLFTGFFFLENMSGFKSRGWMQFLLKQTSTETVLLSTVPLFDTEGSRFEKFAEPSGGESAIIITVGWVQMKSMTVSEESGRQIAICVNEL